MHSARPSSPLSLEQAIPKALQNTAINAGDLSTFQENIASLLASTNDDKSEEHLKNILADFLKATYYGKEHAINVKGRQDLVIHHGKTSSPVGVIFETKRLGSPEMPKSTGQATDINTKALHELVLYYLRERDPQDSSKANLELKHLIITDSQRWYIFDARDFEQHIYNDSALRKQYRDFAAGRLSGNTTTLFYKDIAQPFLDRLLTETPEALPYLLLELADYAPLLRNFRFQETPPHDPSEARHYAKQRKTISLLYWLFAPESLLKLPVSNDSNSLNKAFYDELLHIIGLAEVKQKGKKLITRCPPSERNHASLLESTMRQLDKLDKVRRWSDVMPMVQPKKPNALRLPLS